MNIYSGTSQTKTLWERPVAGPELTANRSQDDIDQWWSLIDRTIEVANGERLDEGRGGAPLRHGRRHILAMGLGQI